MRLCSACDARLFEGAGWCGLCGTALPTPEEASDLLNEATSPGRRKAPWRPNERHLAPPPEKVHSRVHGGPLSLSLRWKIAVSVAAFLVAMWFLLYTMSPGSGLIIFAMLPLFYWDLWRRRRIR